MPTEIEEHISSAIRTKVWSGFYTPGEVRESIEEMIEDEGDPETDVEMLRNSIDSEFASKHAAEDTWPAETDCDRLDCVFAALNSAGVVSLQNAGYTMSDGLSDVFEVKCELEDENENAIGYCFYHGQDLERAIDGGGVTVAFGTWDTDTEKQLAIGRKVKQAFEDEGFIVEWDGSTEHRIEIPKLDWKRRTTA